MRRTLLKLSALAVGLWLLFALVTVTVLSPATRLLSFGLMTGALFIVTLYEMNKKDRDWKKAILLVLGTWLICGVTLLAANRLLPHEEPGGPLTAASDLAPATACSGIKIADDNLLMIVGQSGVVGKGRGPFTPFFVGTCPALSISRNPQGLLVNAFGYDSDNNVVYRIHDNVFDQVMGGFLVEHRPNPSTLVIGDDHGPRVLEIRYLNKTTVTISGTFHCGDSAPINVSANGVAAGIESLDHKQCLALEGGIPRGLRFSKTPGETQTR